MIITLTEEQWREALALAAKRRENDKAHGGRDAIPGTTLAHEQAGYIGEYAIRTWLAQPLPAVDAPDKGTDLIIAGMTAAVKTMKFFAPPLHWPALIPGKQSFAMAPRFSSQKGRLEAEVGIFCQLLPTKLEASHPQRLISAVYPGFDCTLAGRSIEVVGAIGKAEFDSPLVHHLYDYGWGLGPEISVYDWQLHSATNLLSVAAR